MESEGVAVYQQKDQLRYMLIDKLHLGTYTVHAYWHISQKGLIFVMPFFYRKDGDDKARPVIIHRAILGSVERMIAILTENYAGKWWGVFWLHLKFKASIKNFNTLQKHNPLC